MSLTHKSQSALEYMMTYGWAILIIVIVAGVLYSFGVFNPSSSASATITGFSGLGSPQALCMANGGLRLQLGNNLGQTINVTRINVTTNGVTETVLPNQTISPQGTYIFYVPNVCGNSAGARYSFTSSVTYTEPGQVFSGPYFSSGKASGTVSSVVNPGYALYVNDRAYPDWAWRSGYDNWGVSGGFSYMSAATQISGGTNYTVTMWFLGNFTAGTASVAPPNSSATAIDNHVSLFSLTNQQVLSMYQDDQILIHECTSGDTAIIPPGQTNVFDNRWHFVALSVHNPISSIIKDSNYYAQVDSGSAAANNSYQNANSGAPLRIGASSNQCDEGLFTGYISNVQIYGQTLSPTQINQIYQEGILGAPLTGVTLYSYYPMNGTIGRWGKDYSGNNLNGTLTNALVTSNFMAEPVGG